MQKKTSMRIEVENGINGCFIIKDSYDSDLRSLTNHSLAFLEQQMNKALPRTLILSDTEEHKQSTEILYADVTKAVEANFLQKVVFIGEKRSENQAIFDIRQKEHYRTASEFLNSDFFGRIQNEAILVKVSPQFQPEEILNKLRLLVHDTVLEINFDAMFHNVAYFQSKLKPQTKLMCMVKASAYGSGSIEVSKALEHCGCNYLAVAFANEGVELRQAGIDLPILVLDPSADVLERMIDFRLEPEIYSFRILNKMIETAKRKGKQDVAVHIKIDSGMHRAGFEEKDIPELAERLKNQTELKAVSIYSHLAGADESQFDRFTAQQISYFSHCADKLAESLHYPILKHILNTSGIERFSESQFDMVRLGIGLWGISCTQKLLENVCTLKTKVSQTRIVKQTDTVGYSRKGKLTRDSKIALLPLGYADGIDRRLGNGKLNVLINGKKYPTIGNVCMDLIMVDITDSDVKEGDEATIFGNGQTISDIAEILQTIPYEVLTSIAPRVRRVYYSK